MTDSDGFVAAAPLADVPDEGQRLVSVGGRAVLLCRSENQVFAIENRCSHDFEPLQGGRIRKCTIVCPHHGARFNLKNGSAMGPPAFAAIRTFPTRVVGDTIEVKL